ncbi:MAG: PAS domain S-box protein [Myxococcales bacterium]|jgi:PAS domain S-box-containing protein
MESTARVLLLFHDAATRAAVVAALDGGEFDVRSAEADGGGTRELAADADLVLLQLAPGRRSAERVAALKASVHGPLIALLPEDAPNAADEARACGADDFVLLPLRGRELLTRVRARVDARGPDTEHPSRVLLELTRTLVSSLDFQEILYTLVSRVAQVVDVDRVSIVLVPDGGGEVGYVVAASDDAKLSNLRLDLGKYPEIRHTLKTRTSVTIDDVDHHPLLDEVRRKVSGAGLSALTLIPIVWEDHSMGVLFVRAKTQRGALTDEQLRFCEVLANATAIALRNARILQSLRDENQRDLYARLEAEKRLSSLKRYADLLSSSADGIAAFDSDGCLLFANPSAQQIFGYEPDQYQGKPLWELLPHDVRRSLLDVRKELQAGRFPHDVDLRVVRNDGEAVVINGSFAPLSGTEGAVLLSFRDVTADRKTRDELVHTRNFLQSLIEASVDAIVASDMQGTIMLFNQGAQELYGYRAEDAVGKMNARALYPGDGAREVMRMLRSTGHGGAGRLEPVRIEAVDASGSIFPISLTAAMIYEDGVPTATFGIFTDLRERVRVEEQLAQAQEKLAMSEKQALVAELAGATAHELNQPLTSVMGYSELLMRKLDEDSPVRRAAGAIHGETQRMAEIVRKIGKLTRYETKSYVGEQKILDLDRASRDDPDATWEQEP